VITERAVGSLDFAKAGSVHPELLAWIQRYDQHLVVVWDSASVLWSLMRVTPGGYHLIAHLVNEDGTPKSLGWWLRDYIVKADMWSQAPNPDALAKKYESQQNEQISKRTEEFEEQWNHEFGVPGKKWKASTYLKEKLEKL
jgi:hypothetical protein